MALNAPPKLNQNGFLAGDQYNPQGQPQQQAPDTSSWNNQVNGYYSNFLGRQGTPDEVNNWISGASGEGHDLGWIQNQIANSPEAQAYAASKQQQTQQPQVSPQQGPQNSGANYASAVPNATASNTTNLAGSGQSQDLVNLLMKRAGQSLSVDPMTDPVLRPQLDAANAAAQRSNRSYLSQAAESQGANANLGATGMALAENAAQGQSQLAAQLGQNELNARRTEIQNALSEMGSMLTSQQQLSLQQELGLIDSQLRGQQLGNQNDQFLAQLGLQSTQDANYWDALRSGLIRG